jgi:hypothetical protein
MTCHNYAWLKGAISVDDELSFIEKEIDTMADQYI